MSYSLWSIERIPTSFGHPTPKQKERLTKKHSLRNFFDVFAPTQLSELCKQCFFFDQYAYFFLIEMSKQWFLL